MSKKMLREYAENVHSQFGEDGIIKKIFEIVGTTTKRCVEFGAWDGFHLSNTARLWTESWNAVLIEGDRARFEELKEKVKAYKCIPVCAFVGTDHKKDSLEFLIEQAGVRGEIDLLSIDIDGNDYHIFQSLEKLRPRVIICEYNPTIPYYVDVVPKPNSFLGCSLGSLTRLAEEKDYRLVATTETNGFYVLESLYSKFEEFETSIEKLAIPRRYNHVITNYSGECMVIGEFSYGLRGMAKLNRMMKPEFIANQKWHEDLEVVNRNVIKRMVRRAKSFARRIKYPDLDGS